MSPTSCPSSRGVDKKGAKYSDFGIKQISGQNGIALIELPWTPEDFRENYQDTKERLGYRHYINVTNSLFADFYAIEIPFSKALDCITVLPSDATRSIPIRIPSIRATMPSRRSARRTSRRATGRSTPASHLSVSGTGRSSSTTTIRPVTSPSSLPLSA